uniref:Uncharacterized protein n=1 Tax=Cacopsylla melanoneura TaxID=428564 RepID=A0A8D8UR52_9HEMI
MVAGIAHRARRRRRRGGGGCKGEKIGGELEENGGDDQEIVSNDEKDLHAVNLIDRVTNIAQIKVQPQHCFNERVTNRLLAMFKIIEKNILLDNRIESTMFAVFQVKIEDKE